MFPQSNIVYNPMELPSPQLPSPYGHNSRQHGYTQHPGSYVSADHFHPHYALPHHHPHHPHHPAMQGHQPQSLQLLSSSASSVHNLQHPQTPLDLSYSHSMIPSNLLVNSPYFQQTPSVAPPHNRNTSNNSGSDDDDSDSVSSSSVANTTTVHHPPVGFGYGFGIQPPMSPMNSSGRPPNHHYSPYLTHLNNTTSSNAHNITNHNLDQLNLSRTVIMRHLSPDLSLSELLDNIDFGPIEYCKMFSKPTPKHLLDMDPSTPPNLQVCCISFINSKISILFHLKYFKNSQNLNQLKTKLKDSKHLKIHLHDNSSNSVFPAESSVSRHQDLIKLKTLDYIHDFNATRAVLIKFSIKNVVLTPEDVDTLTAVKSFIHTQCSKFGDVENFKISLADPKESKPNEHDEEPESDRIFGKALVHFTSIDSAIKTYESYLRRIQHDTQRTLDQQSSTSKKKSKGKKDEKNVNVMYEIKFSSIVFHKDRCDRSVSSRSPSASQVPITQRKASNPRFNNIPEESASDIPSFFGQENHLESPNPPESTSALAGGLPSSVDTMESITDPAVDALEAPLVNIPIEGNILSKTSSPSLLEPPSPTLSSTSASPTSEHQNIYQHFQAPRPRFDSGYGFVPQTPVNGYSRIQHQQQQIHELQQHNYMLQSQAQFHHPFQQQNQVNHHINPDPYNVDNRTIYLGNLHPNTSVEEIANNVRAGGLVESIRYHPEKKACFITFVDPQVALKFYMNHQILHQLVVHGHDVSVGWAKNHSGPVSREISLAVTAGASRNVYIGIKLIKDANGEQTKSALSLPNEQTLRADFSKFGELEQINFYHNKDCGFLNFMNIIDAIKLVDTFQLDEDQAKAKLLTIFGPKDKSEAGQDPEERKTLIESVDQFYQRYMPFKISFAKDRCGNPPKFSFKKKASNFQGSTYQQYQHLLHGSISKRGKNRNYKSRDQEIYDEETRSKSHDSFMEDTINQEAAMVFGIISNEPKKSEEQDEDEKDEKTDKPAESDTSNGEKSENGLAINSTNESLDDDDDEEEEEDGDDDDDDDDDDVSIIIGSDETSSINAQNNHDRERNSSKSNKPRHNGHTKIYHSKFNSSDPLIGYRKSNSRNSSNISLNSNHSKYSQPPPAPQQKSYKFSSSPYIQQQKMFYLSGGMPGGQANRSFSGYGPVHMQPNPMVTPNPGYYPSQGHHQQYYMARPQSRSQFQYYPGGYPQMYLKGQGQYSTSGSQVMAQYLAKSQHDNLLYASSIVANESGMEEDYDDYIDSAGDEHIPQRVRKTKK